MIYACMLLVCQYLIVVVIVRAIVCLLSSPPVFVFVFVFVLVMSERGPLSKGRTTPYLQSCGLYMRRSRLYNPSVHTHRVAEYSEGTGPIIYSTTYDLKRRPPSCNLTTALPTTPTPATWTRPTIHLRSPLRQKLPTYRQSPPRDID